MVMVNDSHVWINDIAMLLNGIERMREIIYFSMFCNKNIRHLPQKTFIIDHIMHVN